ncbi:Imm1 family immunity protein [Alloactinosynnema sp. L-07]|uniref:Imm1 family immunity protein n=1 Tax=Alloactinosynnema sp. L-07 TaxID=1653480 RepID=UPI002100D6E5|nr:Imm1 family immunity protein [Alloactinosynnema sp. L-07]
MIHRLSRRGRWANKGDGAPDWIVEYVYMGHVTDMTADAEIPIEAVIDGLREFMETGGKPSIIPARPSA